MEWRIRTQADETLEDGVRDNLVAHNVAVSDAVRRRFEPENLASRPVQAFAVADDGSLVGGCTGHTEDLWHWLTIDLMWVDPAARGTGLGRALLASVEDEARARGCRWSKLNTWEFQAPEFYERCGYVTYGREVDLPPGHVCLLYTSDAADE